MNRLTFQVFAKTDHLSNLRLLDQHDNLIGERPLPNAEIEAFADEVKRAYRRGASAQELAALGRRLYEWLDGPTERWLAGLRDHPQGTVACIDVAQRLHHLPWELLFADGGYLCGNAARPFTPLRLTERTRRDLARANRVLFMACSAQDVRPLLSYEREEMGILESARLHDIELVVEESGSLGGLHELAQRDGPDYFDVLHLTGHADVFRDERLITSIGEIGANGKGRRRLSRRSFGWKTKWGTGFR
ncbi:MAG: CHAT domain-containing protein [Blastocatellia bacterium]